MIPLPKWAENLEPTSTHQPQQNPEIISEMADPQKSPPWGITLSSKALRRGWIGTTEMQPQTPPKSSQRQRLILCSISRLKTPARNSIRSSSRMDCVLPLRTAQSMNAPLHKSQTSILLQNTNGKTSLEQALKFPWVWGWDIRTETLNALNSVADRLNS